MRCALIVMLFAWLCACGNPTGAAKRAPKRAPAPPHGVSVKPPFAVRGELEGLLLIWFDEDGKPHAASKRSEVPEASRARVRVDSLEVAPEQRLDPGYVYVADVRAPQGDGAYRVEKWARETFEAALAPPPAVEASPEPVILYGASWCGACKQAARFLTERGVAFVEKDIEKEPGARSELMQKAAAQGVRAQGIPVLDVHGTLIEGFDPGRLAALLERSQKRVPTDKGS